MPVDRSTPDGDPQASKEVGPWPISMIIVAIAAGLFLIALALQSPAPYRHLRSLLRLSEAWQTPAMVCGFGLVLAGVVQLARRSRILGLAFAAAMCVPPVLLWGLAIQLGGLASLVVGILALMCSIWLWPAAWVVARNAMDAEPVVEDHRVPRRRAAPVPLDQLDTMPMPRVLELTVTEEDGLKDLRAQGRRWLMAALAAPLLLYLSFSVTWVFEGIGPRTLVLLWLASGFVGMVGVGRVAQGRRMSTTGRRICKVLAVLPVLNILVFVAFLLLSFNWGQRGDANAN